MDDTVGMFMIPAAIWVGMAAAEVICHTTRTHQIDMVRLWKGMRVVLNAKTRAVATSDTSFLWIRRCLMQCLVHESAHHLLDEVTRLFVVVAPVVRRGQQGHHRYHVCRTILCSVCGGALGVAMYIRWFASPCGAPQNLMERMLQFAKTIFAEQAQGPESGIVISGGGSVTMAMSGYLWLVSGDLGGWLLVLPIALRRLLTMQVGGRWLPSAAKWVDETQRDAVQDTVSLVCFATGVGLGICTKVAHYIQLGRAAERAFGFHQDTAAAAVADDRVHAPLVSPSTDLVNAAQQLSAPAEFICPLTLQLFQQPVVAADGHTYEASSISKWLETSRMSPVCGTQLLHTRLAPNYALRSLMEGWKAPQQQ